MKLVLKNLFKVLFCTGFMAVSSLAFAQNHTSTFTVALHSNKPLDMTVVYEVCGANYDDGSLVCTGNKSVKLDKAEPMKKIMATLNLGSSYLVPEMLYIRSATVGDHTENFTDCNAYWRATLSVFVAHDTVVDVACTADSTVK